MVQSPKGLLAEDLRIKQSMPMMTDDVAQKNPISMVACGQRIKAQTRRKVRL